MLKTSSSQSGFTLIELVIALIVITLLISGMLIPLGTQIQNKRIADTQKTMEEIKEALIGYAIANKRLPGPAISATNGTEVGACNSHATCTGFIPWTTLGINKVDAWGKIIRYSVTPSFTDIPPTITITTKGSKGLDWYDSAGNKTTYVDLAVVLISFGAKNFGTSEAGTVIPNSSDKNIYEQRNNATKGDGASVNPDDHFVYRPMADSTDVVGGDFDDILTWIPSGVLINRMGQTGAFSF